MREDTKNSSLPSLLNSGSPTLNQPSVAVVFSPLASEYRTMSGTLRACGCVYASHWESGAQVKSWISHAPVSTSVTFLVATSTNCNRFFLSLHAMRVESGDHAMPYL